jgi:Flp pilus assembly protein TadG
MADTVHIRGKTIRRGARLLRDRRGAAAVEFALAAPLLVLLTLAIIELGLMVLVQSQLDGASRNAARLIRTGQAQITADPKTAFVNLLCNDMNSFVACPELSFYVQTFPSFSAAATTLKETIPRDEDGKVIGTIFVPGGPSQIVTIRVMYNRPFITPWVGKYLGGAHESAFLRSTVVFLNEPFSL